MLQINLDDATFKLKVRVYWYFCWFCLLFHGLRGYELSLSRNNTLTSGGVWHCGGGPLRFP